MDVKLQEKWNASAAFFDLMSGLGPELRWRPHKRALFETMGTGRILFLAVGTGLDIASFPPGRDIVGIDVSPKMLAKAERRAAAYPGRLELKVMDAQEMDFPDHAFDEAFTSCTFCSVPDPLKGLAELRRVLKPGGRLSMFEHTGSRHLPVKLTLDFMNPFFRPIGPSINRNTVANVIAAGFRLQRVENVYMDVVRIIRATSP